MKRDSFIVKTGEKPEMPDVKDFSMTMKHYHKAINMNTFIMDAFDKAEKMINEDITWSELATENYFVLRLVSHKNIEICIFAKDMANATVPSLAQRIVDAIKAK